jgi:carboxyl-terminal processing protease
MSNSPPFPPGDVISVVVPTRFESLPDADRQLLRSIPVVLDKERTALSRELGAPIALVEADPGTGSRWLIGPATCNPDIERLGLPRTDSPRLVLDRQRRILVADAPTPAQVWETFSLLRSLARFPGGTLLVADCRDVEEAVARIADEVNETYPAFSLRGIDWAAVCERHTSRVLASDTPELAMQEWLAELHDAHTWVRPAATLVDLPYEVWIGNGTARLTEVPVGSPAWDAGARRGFELLGYDAEGWWRRTAATPHARPLLAGRRSIEGEPGGERQFEAESPSGERVSWRETLPPRSWENPVAWRVLPSGTGLLRIRVWSSGSELNAAIDAAFDDLRRCANLIVDLRGNGGGDITLAMSFRDRFLREPGVLGWIRHSISHDALSDAEPIRGEPAPRSARWTGPVRFLTDPLTYSSSEDALLGLQGLPHVEVVGEPSGGGSGRVRTLRLTPNWRLTISTALTYDRNECCIEGAGIPVDRLIAPDRFAPDAVDVVLEEADRGW